MSRTAKLVMFSGLGLFILMAVAVIFVYRASQQVPEFYTKALEVEPTMAAEAGEVLEEQVFALSNQIKKPQRWKITLTEEQINGWLASDLEEKFPKLMPPGISKPRIAVNEDELQLACKFKGQQFQSVMSLSVDVFLVEDEPNVVAIRIHQASAGALPVPLSNFLDEISKHTTKAKVPIRWKQMENDPVALITVPESGEEIEGTIRVDTILLETGKIHLAGETIKAAEEETEVAAAQ